MNEKHGACVPLLIDNRSTKGYCLNDDENVYEYNVTIKNLQYAGKDISLFNIICYYSTSFIVQHMWIQFHSIIIVVPPLFGYNIWTV